MWRRFGYYSPQLVYETLVAGLVTDTTRWLDVGGGKSLFPHNEPLAAALAQRCALLVGVDPSDNIRQNPYVHEFAQCTMEQYASDARFDLATLRMVAEHISRPEEAVGALARMMVAGGRVVVYTPNRWSPASIAARMVPNAWHHRITKGLWNTQEEDVFPTVYRLNTRRDLAAAFTAGGFREAAFARLDACYVAQRFRATCFAELLLWRLLRSLKLRYPENNLLGVYERVGDEEGSS